MSDTILREKGSFRDPSGYVFYYQQQPFRAIQQEPFLIIDDMRQSGLLQRLIDQNFIIPTDIIQSNTPLYQTLQEKLPEESHFLQHTKIPLVNYPYEWSVSMLADAAILQLRLQLDLISNGYSLKDASMFNVQFIGSKPVFIDILSLEPIQKKELWIALGQFCQMHLFPLLLKYYKNISIQNSLLGNINGITVEDIYRVFGFWGSLRPALLLDVFMQNMAQRAATKNNERLKERLAHGGTSTTPQELNLKRMVRKIEKLASKYAYKGHWADYVNTNTYTQESEAQKLQYIDNFMQKYNPATVLDLGCNTGQYSFQAQSYGAKVIAVDSDHDSVDLLYQRAKKEKADILPMCIDIANPSPAIGFCNQERKSFMERVSAEAVFALALIHHLLITSRVPLTDICDFFARLTSRYLIIEFVGRDDKMFKHLLALREDIYGDINKKNFLAVFCEKFDLLDEYPLPNSQRILFTFRKRCP